MTLKFDITGIPPTADAIESERARLAARLIYITRLGWSVAIALGLLDAGLWAWWAWWQDGMVNNALLAIALTAAAIAILAAAVASAFVAIGAPVAFAFAVVAGAVVAFAGAAAVTTGAAGAAAVVAGAWWAKARSSLRERIDRLDPAAREACLDIVTWLHDPALPWPTRDGRSFRVSICIDAACRKVCGVQG